MRVVIQRVESAEARLGGEVVAAIGEGLVALVGLGREDDREAVAAMARKVANLRMFEEGERFVGRSLLEVGGGVLTVSQVSLYADTSRGRRPNLSRTAATERARELYAAFADELRSAGVAHVASAPFQTTLILDARNRGPLTVVLESGDPPR